MDEWRKEFTGYRNVSGEARIVKEGSVYHCYPPRLPDPPDLSRVTCKHSDAIVAAGYPSHPMSEPCPLNKTRTWRDREDMQDLAASVDQVCRLLES